MQVCQPASANLVEVSKRAELMPEEYTENGQLTSLKRFQCLILRLYCEMVDSHCSSSIKFPAFSASFPLFASARTEDTSARSGTRRNVKCLIPTVNSGYLRRNLSLRLSSCCLLHSLSLTISFAT